MSEQNLNPHLPASNEHSPGGGVVSRIILETMKLLVVAATIIKIVLENPEILLWFPWFR